MGAGTRFTFIPIVANLHRRFISIQLNLASTWKRHFVLIIGNKFKLEWVTFSYLLILSYNSSKFRGGHPQWWHSELAVNQPRKQAADWGADRTPIESLQVQQHRPRACMCVSVCPIQYVARSIQGRKEVGGIMTRPAFSSVLSFLRCLSLSSNFFTSCLQPTFVPPSLIHLFPSCHAAPGITPLALILRVSPRTHLCLRHLRRSSASLWLLMPPLPFSKIPFPSDPLPTTTLSTPPLKPGHDNSALSLMHHSWFCSLMHFLSPSQSNHQIFIVGFYDFF